jgi:hypothetical protein
MPTSRRRLRRTLSKLRAAQANPSRRQPSSLASLSRVATAAMPTTANLLAPVTAPEDSAALECASSFIDATKSIKQPPWWIPAPIYVTDLRIFQSSFCSQSGSSDRQARRRSQRRVDVRGGRGSGIDIRYLNAKHRMFRKCRACLCAYDGAMRDSRPASVPARLDQANGTAAQIVRFPVPIGDTMLPKQALRDFAIAVSLQPPIHGTHSKDKPLPTRERQSKRGRPEGTQFERRPKSKGCLRG